MSHSTKGLLTRAISSSHAHLCMLSEVTNKLGCGDFMQCCEFVNTKIVFLEKTLYFSLILIN